MIERPPAAIDVFRQRVKHPMRVERLVAALVDRYERRIQMLLDAETDKDGRLLFQIPLSDEEVWGRWADPAKRQEVIDGIRAENQADPDRAVAAYINEMANLDAKLHRNGKNGTK